MTRQVRFACVLLLAILFTSSALVPQALAQTSTPQASPGALSPDAGPSFVIRPVDGADGDYFTLEAESGTTNELTVVLGNADDESLTLRTYVNDTVPVVNGGFAIADEEVPATGTATWIDYSAETLIFEPGNGIERTFTVTVPPDTAPGEYIAGLALQTAEALEVEGTSLFTQIIRKTIAVFIIVPGPEKPAFSIGEPVLITDGTVRIDIPVQNTGNVLVRPTGELSLVNEAGETVVTAPIAMGSVYAGMTVPLSAPLNTPLPDGNYEVSIALADPESGVTAAVSSFGVSLTAPDDTPVQFSLDGTVTLAPDLDAPVYADVAATITNNGDPIDNAAVVIEATKDGELVEVFTLVPTLALPQGSTDITQRYIPPAGFEAGTWTFILRLVIVDPSSGAETTVATLDTIAPVTVGS